MFRSAKALPSLEHKPRRLVLQCVTACTIGPTLCGREDQRHDAGQHVFWWRKRSEGFEWRDYVRTTILVRREQRRQRIKDVQAAAAAHVKDAGKRGLDAGIAGARNAGTGLGAGLGAARSGIGRLGAAAGAWSLRAARATGAAAIAAAGVLWTAVSAAAQRLGAPLGPLLEPLLVRVRAPRVDLALKIVAVLAGLGAVYRTWTFGLDADALFATIVCAVAATLLLLARLTDPYRDRRPRGRDSLLGRLSAYEFELPGERRLSAGRAGLALVALVAVAALGSAIFSYAPSVSVADLGSSAPVTTGALPAADPTVLAGRAVAVTGDTLRIAATTVRLDDIEAPEATQNCRRTGKSGTWRCGAAAREALAALVRGRRVTCDILDETNGRKRARCYAGNVDIAEAQVRKGHAFAHGGFWSRYAGVESEAETQKVGLWAGEAERPQDYRDKRWEEARKTSPDGCPIKGSIRSGARTYVLPWASGYDGLRLRTSRGERWFCSESEAEAAGWTRGSSS